MANITPKLQLFRSTVAGRKPTTAQIKEGQLAVNLTDKRLYTKLGTTILSVGHGADATIEGSNTWTGKVKSATLESGATTLGGTTAIWLDVKQDLKVTGKATISNGLELSAATPYIDFHHGNSTADYTHRIIASTATDLEISAKNVNILGAARVTTGLAIKGSSNVRPLDGQNNEWANIGFYDAGDSGTQRGAVWGDVNGNVGLLSRGGNSMVFQSDALLNIPTGELRVGSYKGGVGENQDARDKAQFYNKGWIHLSGSNVYFENNDPNQRRIRQVNGMRMYIQDSDLESQDYFIERIGERHFRAIAVQGAGMSGWFEFRNNGDMSCTGVSYAANHVNTSDIRLKKDLYEIENPLDKLKKITGYDYELHDVKNDTWSKSTGLIAQDVQKILPNAVCKIGEKDYLGINYSAVTALLVNSVKELNAKVENLQKQVIALKNIS